MGTRRHSSSRDDDEEDAKDVSFDQRFRHVSSIRVTKRPGRRTSWSTAGSEEKDGGSGDKC